MQAGAVSLAQFLAKLNLGAGIAKVSMNSLAAVRSTA
jgi:hypothetical protein